MSGTPVDEPFGRSSTSSLARNLGQILLAGVAAFAITAVGQGVWGVMAMANARLTPAIPWAALVMPIVLAAMATFLVGVWPRRGGGARRAVVPWGPVPGKAWLWSLIAGAAGILALAALWTVMAQVVRVAPNVLPDTRGIPVVTLVSFLLVGIVAAPVTEEIAFRGYAMSLLRRRYSPAAALVISSILFAAAHLTQGLSAPKLIVYLLVGLTLGFTALRTGSLAPAMVVHGFGDLVFFTLVWNHDAGRRLISEGGADAGFFARLVAIAILAPACLLALRRLVQVTAAVGGIRSATPRGVETAAG